MYTRDITVVEKITYIPDPLKYPLRIEMFRYLPRIDRKSHFHFVEYFTKSLFHLSKLIS